MATSPANRKRVQVLGCPLDSVTMDEAVHRCEEAIVDGRGSLRQISINAAKVIALHDDPALRDMIASFGLITADGQSVVWAARLLGSPIPERVAGIDLMQRLLAAADEHGFRVFILGARKEVLAKAIENLMARYPRLVISGSRDGYFDDDELPEICEEIRLSRSDILFVAMSSPRKEYFLGQQGESLDLPFAMGVGGSVDVIAGVTRRAPRIMRRTGLEWAYRLWQEPRRLAKRYLVTNGRFLGMMFKALLTRRGSDASSEAPS